MGWATPDSIDRPINVVNQWIKSPGGRLHFDSQHHLQPIPIDTRACPYVNAMHTAEQLHLGRIQLHEAKSWEDLALGSASDIDKRGQTAFGNASDLIGMACGVHVGV